MKSGTLAARLCRSAAIGALLAATSYHAYAQQTPSTQTVDTVQPAEPQDEQTGDRVVITGSRLANQFSSSAPMDIVTAEEAESQGITDVASLLRSTTVAAGSPQITAITSTAFVQNGGIGSESISLRGLGANRTLVLLDGRRAGPAGTRGAVGAFDLNVIPLSAIERVEILKDGASSIYGSDAVAGVVNIITKKGDGADIDIFGSAPLDGGGEQFRINGSWGETFGENLRVRVTADYFKQEALRRGDRDFFSCSQPYVFRADGSRADLVDPRTGSYICSGDLPWGQIWYYDYEEPGAITRPWQARPQFIQYNYGNKLQQYLPGFGPTTNPATFGANWFPVGYGELNRPTATPDPFYQPSARISEALIDYKHPYQDLVSLSPEVERMTIMGSGEYDINDGMKLYGEALLNRRTTRSYGYRQFWTYQYVAEDGAGGFVGDQQAIAAGFTGVNIGLSPLSITDHANDTITVDYMRFVGGARGDLPFNTWTWDVSAQFSRSDGDYKSDIVWDDAISAEEFRNDLCAGEVTVYRGAPCVDIPWYDPNFLNGVFTPQQEAFLFGTVTGNTVYEQTSLEGYVTGDLFQLPAGPIGVVFGALYQEDSIDDVPAQEVQDGQAWGSSSAQITRGEDTTTAVYTEVGVPLFKGLPFVEELTLTASGRYNDVDSYGAESTYKVGLNWAVTPTFRVRASQGTSFRSPALFELFLQAQTAFVGQRVIDPCINWGANLASGGISQRIADNCAADGIPNNHNGSGDDATTITSGGFGTLDAETSTSKSFGFIWSPEFIDLSVSIDYFDIEVENEVTLLGATNIMFGCYDSLNFASEPLCNLFTRSPGGSATQFLVEEVTDNYLNISTQQNRGIDLDAIYKHKFGFGELTLRGQAAYQLEDEVKLLPSSDPLDNNGLIGDPEWVGNFDATLETGPFEFFYSARYVGETSNAERFGTQPQTYQLQPVRYVLGTDSFVYHNISVAVEPDEGLTVRLGVSNVLDEKPPFVTELSGEFNSTIGNVPVVSNYDFFGRTVFLNVAKTF
ncbi:MAG: TonB-dependent receptor [Hyphomonadaceae bacterium]|nr:TonB-dependent receptor [Hyphomonadaceae bacterium]